MRYILFIGCFVVGLLGELTAQDTALVRAYAERLVKAYPDCIVGIENNYVVFKNGARLLFDDGRSKTLAEQYAAPDIEDMLKMVYVKGATGAPAEGQDPGRIRNDTFFKTMYGASAAAVQRHLVPITWLPKTAPQVLRVSRINGVDKRLQAISQALEQLPAHLLPYVQQVAGTFSWRLIKGTDRISTHSFGITMDINLKYSNYWQWDHKTTDEHRPVPGYKNRIPPEIVAIFEQHGFIWGGKWYHYDTMHFEYRPELLTD